MQPYQAILFDFDGVLVDSEPVHYACWRETLAPFGIKLDWDTYQRRCIGITDRAMLEELCRLAEPRLDLERLWQEYPRKRARFRERMLSGDPISGEVKTLLELLDGYGLAVVSSSGRAEVEPVLEAGGIRRYFGAVLCREDVARHKPAPDPYRAAAARLGATRALVVEDSPAGIASGRAAGFDVLAIPAAHQMPTLLRRLLFPPEYQ
jgi:beta-phosphoglucomutase